MPIELDLAIRLITIGADLLLILIVATRKVRLLLRFSLVGLLVGSIGYLLISAPAFGIPPAYVPFIDIFAVSTPFWIWLFARLLFDRQPTPHLAGLIITSVMIAWFLVHFVDAARMFGFIAIHALGLTLVGDIVFTAWSGNSDDLVERRRIIRRWLPVLVGVQASVILAYELLFGTGDAHQDLQLLNSVSILALSMLGGMTLLQTDVELLAETQKKEGKQSDKRQFSSSEIVLNDKLVAAMDAGIYRSDGLTIAILAMHLHTPEHRLRALINQRLGFRNFSSYLNSHRIAEATKILADREQVDLPVTTIAMDLGYSSISTFNRAFRELVGQTPTEFRSSAIQQNEVTASAF